MKRLALIPPLALVLALLLSPVVVEAKTGGRIRGKVLTRDGQALMGAVVTIFKEDRDGGTILYTRSDHRGEYSFRDVTPGHYSFQVNHEGFKPLVKPSMAVSMGKTMTLNVVLLELLDAISSDDPRNWGVATVMRSTSDRRLIFRNLDDSGAPEAEPRFERGGAVNLTSSAQLSGGDYSVFPNKGFSGVVSNFAYSEPVTQSARMIVAGQLSAGYDTMWRVRNTFQYLPQTGRDLKFTLGYGRQNLAATTMGAMTGPAQFFAVDPSFRDAGVETLGMGFSSSDRFLNTFSIEYGFDFSQVRHGITKRVFSPHFQLLATPARGWAVKSMMASRRISDANSITLPDGEFVNLMEPVYITKVGGQLNVSQFKHSELGVERALGENSSVELALYDDRMSGPGIPLAVTIKTAKQQESRLGQLQEDQTKQRGIRIVVRHRFLDSIGWSLGYVYARAYGLDGPEASAPGSIPAGDLTAWIQSADFHSLMGSINTKISRTNTDMSATLRWYPGNPATPIDLFSDRMDTEGKGVAFCVRQLIPLPEFLYGAGHWVALVDVRNLFDQGRYVIPTNDGVLVLTPNPRYVRFGLNLSFN